MLKTYVDKKTELMKLVKDNYFFSDETSPVWPPFYIFSYNPADELKARELANEFGNEIESKGHKTVHINLYELVLEILINGRITLDDYIEQEEKRWFKYIIDKIIPWMLWNTSLINKFLEKSEWADLVYVTHIGTSWPFYRVHLLLDKLVAANSTQNKTRFIFFYPWEYKKNSNWQRFLSLFNEFSEWSYYRAVSICE